MTVVKSPGTPPSPASATKETIHDEGTSPNHGLLGVLGSDLHPADARIARREDDHFAAYHVTDAEYAEMLARALEAPAWA